MCRYASGDQYDGEWLDGKRHGKGVYLFSGGDKYVGEWANNQWAGFGVHTRALFKDVTTQEEFDGYRYEGEFKAGKKDGKGTLLLGNGDSYDGEFMADHYHGEVPTYLLYY
jgi:hypothetical protein